MKTLLLALLIGLMGWADACEKPNRFEKAGKRASENISAKADIIKWGIQLSRGEITIDEFLDLVDGLRYERKLKESDEVKKFLEDVDNLTQYPKNSLEGLCLKWLGATSPVVYEIVPCPKEPTHGQ